MSKRSYWNAFTETWVYDTDDEEDFPGDDDDDDDDIQDNLLARITTLSSGNTTSYETQEEAELPSRIINYANAGLIGENYIFRDATIPTTEYTRASWSAVCISGPSEPDIDAVELEMFQPLDNQYQVLTSFIRPPMFNNPSSGTYRFIISLFTYDENGNKIEDFGAESYVVFDLLHTQNTGGFQTGLANQFTMKRTLPAAAMTFQFNNNYDPLTDTSDLVQNDFRWRSEAKTIETETPEESVRVLTMPDANNGTPIPTNHTSLAFPCYFPDYYNVGDTADVSLTMTITGAVGKVLRFKYCGTPQEITLTNDNVAPFVHTLTADLTKSDTTVNSLRKEGSILFDEKNPDAPDWVEIKNFTTWLPEVVQANTDGETALERKNVAKYAWKAYAPVSTNPLTYDKNVFSNITEFSNNFNNEELILSSTQNDTNIIGLKLDLSPGWVTWLRQVETTFPTATDVELRRVLPEIAVTTTSGGSESIMEIGAFGPLSTEQPEFTETYEAYNRAGLSNLHSIRYYRYEFTRGEDSLFLFMKRARRNQNGVGRATAQKIVYINGDT